ncbi:MAG: ABC-F family ATP-binding cassette domain-containing protein [Clostridia bacterium]|nr:ABC-F family ATP-binding cassette domain-containing protein [Clostridia bacterium]
MQIENLTILHKKDGREMIRGLSLALRPGDRAALIGEEGDGKSTLLKLLYDERLVEDYAEWTGKIRKEGERIAYLAQELSPEETGTTVDRWLQRQGVKREKTAGALRGSGMILTREFGERRISSLSGGEKVKLRLAALAAGEPDVWLLDEPSNDLDMETLEALERFLLGLRKPVLYVSHDRRLLERTANRVVHVESIKRRTESRVTVSGEGYRDYVASREEAFVREERIARKEHEEFREKKERWDRIYRQVDKAQENASRAEGGDHIGRLLKKKMHAVKSMGRRLEKEEAALTHRPEKEEAIVVKFRPESAIPQGKRVLEFSLPELSAGEKVLARDVFLRITGPEKVAVVGKNGAGKTTLLRLIARETAERRDIRAAYMPQDYRELLGAEKDPVSFLAKTGDREEITRLRTFLGGMRYTAGEMSHPVEELSGGQKAKLILLKMMEERASFLILDEPTRNLSPLSGPVIAALLRDFPGAILMTSHDRAFLEEVPDRILELTEEGLRERKSLD